MTLILENVNKSVGEDVHLADIDLAFARGTFNVLLGPTLAGKTSLLRMMAGLDRPTSGRILADGKDVTRVDLRRRNVAMVYQQFINYPSFTVYDNIASPLRIGKAKNAREIDGRVRETAELLGLSAFLDRLPSELSGGQQQRTALARALVKDADLLLLDEPLINLDYKLREGLRSQIRKMFRQRDSIVIYSTSEPEEALLLGGNTVVLDEGRVLQFGPTLEVYNNPATARVGRIFNDPPMNVLTAEVAATPTGLSARLSDDLDFPLPDHLSRLTPGAYRLGVRAADLDLVATSPVAVAVDAIIALAEINGSETLIHAHRGDLAFVAQIEGVHSFGLGNEITLYFDPDRLFAFGEDDRLAASPYGMRETAA